MSFNWMRGFLVLLDVLAYCNSRVFHVMSLNKNVIDPWCLMWKNGLPTLRSFFFVSFGFNVDWSSCDVEDLQKKQTSIDGDLSWPLKPGVVMKAKTPSSPATRRHRRGKPREHKRGRKGQANVATKIPEISTQEVKKRESVKVVDIVSSRDVTTMTIYIIYRVSWTFLSCSSWELIASPSHLIGKMSFLLMLEINCCMALELVYTYIIRYYIII